MAATKKKNGTVVKKLPVDKKLPFTVKLPEEYGHIRDAKASMDVLVPKITGITVQIEVLKSQQAQLVKEYVDLDQKLGEAIRRAASEHDVALDGQTSWNFNIPELTFTKVDPS